MKPKPIKGTATIYGMEGSFEVTLRPVKKWEIKQDWIQGEAKHHISDDLKKRIERALTRARSKTSAPPRLCGENQ